MTGKNISIISQTPCKICSSVSVPFASATILDRYTVQYFQCSRCFFVQTEEPYWLAEAYADTITRSDMGLLSRNSMFATLTKTLILFAFHPNAQFLDYGGGYGVFVRLLRDSGLDFYWYDTYTKNLFAQGFEARLDQQYELVTAFEVFEHLVDPLAELEQMLLWSRNILFSTNLIPAHNPLPDEWWYYGLEHGQHVSLYTYQAFVEIARKYHLYLYSDQRALHLLTEKKIPGILFKLITHPRRAKVASFLLDKLFLRRSLLKGDYVQRTGKVPYNLIDRA